MRYRLTFMGGVVVGYVLGARAGRERYEQLRKSAQQVAQNPAVRNAAQSAGQTGRDVAVKAAAAVTAKVGDRLPPKVAERVRRLTGNGAPVEDDWGTSNT
ncbi:YtxH domain-containing protein [Streptomyces sp. NPDC059373]